MKTGRRAGVALACFGLLGGCLWSNIPDLSSNAGASASSGGSGETVTSGAGASSGSGSTGTSGHGSSGTGTAGLATGGATGGEASSGGLATTGSATSAGTGSTASGTTGSGTEGSSSGGGSSSTSGTGGTGGAGATGGGPAVWTACLATTPFAIDADPVPWANVPGFFVPYTDALVGPTYPVAPTSNAELSATVQTAWDATSLYVFVQVTDPVVVDQSQAPYLYENDGVEVYVDGLNSGLASYDAGDYQFTVTAFGAGAGYQDSPVAIDGGLWSFAAALTGAGYDVEVGLPWSLLLGNDGGAVGFDVAVNGNDGGGPWRESQLMWSGDGGAFFDPRQFGQLTLSPLPCGNDGG